MDSPGPGFVLDLALFTLIIVACIAILFALRWLMDRWQARRTPVVREDEAQTYPALPTLPSEPVMLWDAHRWREHTHSGGDAA